MNPKKRLGEIDARAAEIVTEMDELEAIEAPTDENTARYAELEAEAVALADERPGVAERAEKVAAVRAAATPANRTPAFEAPQINVKADRFENLDSVVRGVVPEEAMRAQALTVIEEGNAGADAHKERMTELVESHDGILSQYIIAAANPAYRSAFAKIMASDSGQAYLTPEEGQAVLAVQRTALSTTGQNGGHAIPAFSDVSLIYTGTQTTNAVRSLATIKTGTTKEWKGLSSAGVTAYYKAEGVAVTDGSPTFAQPVITSHQGSAFILGSLEVFDDTALLSDIPALVQEAKDDLESNKFINGTGTGEPVGLAYALTASKVDTTNTGTTSVTTSTVVAEFDALALAQHERYQDGASVIANRNFFHTARNSTVAQAGTSFWNDFGKGVPSTIRGYDAYIASHMNGTYSTTGNVVAVLGDIAKTFYIYDRLGMTLEPTGHIVSTTTGLPTGQKGYLARWRHGSQVVNLNASKMLVVK